MRYTRTALGLLNAQYRSVLKKCLMINLGLFALGAGAANADEYTLNAADLSTSKNISWKEISADEYDPNNKNMLKVDLSSDKSQYFEYTYTQPADGTVYDTRKTTLTGDITADFKDITSNVDGGALVNAAGNTLNITGDFLHNQINNTGSGNDGGAIYNLGTLSLKGDMIGNSIVRDGGAYGGAISTETNNANITEIIGNYIGNYLVSNTNNALGGAIFNNNGAAIGKINGKFIDNYAIGNLNRDGYVGAEGGVISNRNSKIESITGEFINNYTKNVSGQSFATGGAIGNRNANGIIGSIEAVFINNYTEAPEGTAQGGAIYNYTASHIGDVKGKFTGNHLWSKTESGGGAVFNMNATMDNIYADFTNNYIYSEGHSYGGAIANLIGGTYSGEISIKDVVGNFTNNYAEAKNSWVEGGAINNSSAKMGNITGSFTGNYAKSEGGYAHGGAIYNYNSILGNITGDFTGNYAKSGQGSVLGGALANPATTLGIIKGNFINNFAQSTDNYVCGGAIASWGKTQIEEINSDFTGNYAQSTNSYVRGGAIYNYSQNSDLVINSITGDFTDNYALSENGSANSGAIYNQQATINNIKGNFTNNYTLSKNNQSNGGAILNLQSTINEMKGNFTKNYAISGGRASGGAINNSTSAVIGSITGDFNGNYAESNGGAAAARGGALINLGNITNLTANFSNNHALTNGTFAIGGAIVNNYWNDMSKGITTLSGSFSNNFAQTTGTGDDAYAQGGAIYNGILSGGLPTISDIQSATFTGNYVSGASEQTDGGAIWNAGNIGFSGNNVFKDNYKIVNGVKTANDIYNSGAINVAENGSLDISGGISGDGNGQINLTKNSVLNLNDSTAAGNNLTLEEGATLAFNVNEINTADTTQSGGKVDGDIKLNADSNLKVSTYVEHGVVSGEGTYKFANTVDTADGKWKLNTIIANSLYNYDFKLNDENNTLILEFAKKNAGEIAEEFDTSKDKAQEILEITDAASDNEQFNRISETVNKQAQTGDKNLPRALDDLNDNTQANLETGRYLGDIIAKNVADRLNTRPDKGSVYGLAGGDVSEYEPEIWANAVYQSAENSGDLDYSADTKGVIAAVDGKAGQNWTVGAGYSYLQTDLDSGSKSSDIDDHTVFAYAEYNRNSWFVNGLAAYHWLSFDQDKKAFGENVKGSFDMQMLGLQALVGREFYGCAENHVLRLRPQAGLRYYKISQDGYTDSAGMSYNDADSDVLTGVLGVSLTDETEMNGYKVMPKAFVNATYDLQNDDNTTIVSLPNGGSYAVAQESNGKFGVETGIGVEVAVSDNAKIGLTYEYDWRDDYSAHTGLLNLKYAF